MLLAPRWAHHCTAIFSQQPQGWVPRYHCQAFARLIRQPLARAECKFGDFTPLGAAPLLSTHPFCLSPYSHGLALPLQQPIPQKNSTKQHEIYVPEKKGCALARR